ncbi:MAG TPA: serine esterase [Methylomirabilota bacterium]|nr:serine esterase [Methylomirabilota bacterium]
MLHTELIPAAEKNSRRLMIMLHGLGDSIEGYRWLPQALNLPWLNYLLVNAPDEYFGGFSWFNYPDDTAPGILRSRKLLFELLDDLRAKNFPAEQIMLGGFSQGCLLTIDVGLRYPHKLAGLVGISGWVFEIENLLKKLSPVAKQQRLLISHGQFDSLIPFAPVREQARQLKSAGLNVEWHEFPKDHTIYGVEEISVIREFVRAGYFAEGRNMKAEG